MLIMKIYLYLFIANLYCNAFKASFEHSEFKEEHSWDSPAFSRPRASEALRPLQPEFIWGPSPEKTMIILGQLRKLNCLSTELSFYCTFAFKALVCKHHTPQESALTRTRITGIRVSFLAINCILLIYNNPPCVHLTKCHRHQSYFLVSECTENTARKKEEKQSACFREASFRNNFVILTRLGPE